MANPSGPPVRGWQEVSGRLDLAASNYRDGRDYEFENIARVIAPELAYTVEIERIRTHVGGSEELTPLAIRATTVFRREDGNWKVTHRHGADHVDATGGIGASELGEAFSQNRLRFGRRAVLLVATHASFEDARTICRLSNQR